MATGDLLYGFHPVARIIPIQGRQATVVVGSGIVVFVLIVIVHGRAPSRQIIVDESLVMQLGVQGSAQRHTGTHLATKAARYAARSPLGPLRHLALGVDISADHRLRNVPGALLTARYRLLQPRWIRHPFTLLARSLLLVLPRSRLVTLTARSAALTPRTPLGNLTLRITLVDDVQLLAGLVVAVPFWAHTWSPLKKLLLAVGLLRLDRVFEQPTASLTTLSATGTALGPLVPRFGFTRLFRFVVFVIGFAVLLVESLPGEIDTSEWLHLRSARVVEWRTRIVRIV